MRTLYADFAETGQGSDPAVTDPGAAVAAENAANGFFEAGEEFDGFKQYLKETHGYPLLDREQERELASTIYRSGRELRRRVLTHRRRSARRDFEQSRSRMIGKLLNVTRERVRQLEAEALERLRAGGGRRRLSGLLEVSLA